VPDSAPGLGKDQSSPMVLEFKISQAYQRLYCFFKSGKSRLLFNYLLWIILWILWRRGAREKTGPGSNDNER